MKQAMLKCLVNGRAEQRINVQDRGLQYGDGVFETIKAEQGRCLRLDRHLQRLEDGCRRLLLPVPSHELLLQECKQLASGIDKAIIKIIISRGAGGRGYKIPGETHTTRIVMLYVWPDHPHSNTEEGVQLRLCRTLLSCHPQLAGIKHLNRLENILARNEWHDEDIAEGIMCDSRGNVIEGTMSNLFMVKNGILHTPCLSDCGITGIMREQVLQFAAGEGITTRQEHYKPDDLYAAAEVFITNSIIGIWPVKRIGEQDYTPGPVTKRLIIKLAPSGNDN